MTAGLAARAASAGEVTHFRQYGFVHLRGLLAASQVAQLLRGVEDAIAAFPVLETGLDLTAFAEESLRYAAAPPRKRRGRSTAPFDPRILGEEFRRRGTGPLMDHGLPGEAQGRWLLANGLHRWIPALREFAAAAELGKIAAQLLDCRSVRFYNDLLCVKEAHTHLRAAFRQDISYLHVGATAGCTFWLFVDPVREGLGALGYVPGSHRWGQIFKPNFLVSDVALPECEGAEQPGIDAAPEAFGVQYVEAEPGDVIAHHVLCLHCRQGNRGSQPSRAFGLHYVDAAACIRLRPGIGPPPEPRRGVLDGAPLDDALHPVVWPPPPPAG